jgi:hypothetical protein
MATPSKTDDKKPLTFADISAMPRGERYALFKDNVVKPFGAIAKAKDIVIEKLHNAMKVAAALKRDYAVMLHGKEIAPDTTETAFFKQYCGGDVPARVKQLATFFNAVCLTGPKPLIPEAFIDAASANSLEKAAPIIATERKNSPEAWMGTDITLDVVNALSTPGDATKKLREIRARQTAKPEDEGSEETPASALVMLLKNRITEAKDDEDGYRLFVACQELAEAWGQNTLIPPTRYNEWLKKREDESKPKLENGQSQDTPDAEAKESEAEESDAETKAETAETAAH